MFVGVSVIWWKHFKREKSWKTFSRNLSFSLPSTRTHAQPSCFRAEPAPSPCPPPRGFAIKQQGNLPWWPDVLWYFSTDNIKWEVKCCNTCSCWLCTHSAQAASTLLNQTPLTPHPHHHQHHQHHPINKLNYLVRLGSGSSPELRGNSTWNQSRRSKTRERSKQIKGTWTSESLLCGHTIGEKQRAR